MAGQPGYPVLGSGWRKPGDSHGNIITLNEIISGHQHGSGQPITSILQSNFKRGIIPAVGGLLGTKIMKKLVRQIGVNNEFNKMVRSVGLGDMVKA